MKMTKHATIGGVIFAALLGSVLMLVSCSEDKVTQFKKDGYTLKARLDPDPPIVGENALVMELTAPGNEAVAGADVSVRAYMPAMGAMPAMEARGKGDESSQGRYRAAFSLSMSGNWDLTVTAQKDGKVIVEFPLLVAPPRPGITGTTELESGLNGGEHAAHQHGAVAPPSSGGEMLQVSESRQQLIGVRTEEVLRRPLSRTIRTVGRVEVDETKLWHVTLKFGGWIEHLFVNFTSAFVRKGDPLLKLYSQELYVSQQEYLDALAALKSGGSRSLVDAAEERLRLWDLTDAQIQEIARRGSADKYLTVYSPATGYVIQKNIIEGHQVEPGARLYEIADLSSVWVIADIYEYEASLVEVGQVAWVQSPYAEGTRRKGKVEYIYPQIDLRTRTLPVRLAFENPDLALKPGMFVDVRIVRPLGEQIAVPMEAVLYSGEHRYVFVNHGGGRLEPREIHVAQKADNFYAVLHGIEEGERVVVSANFLIDSEAQLKGALPKWGMGKPGDGDSSASGGGEPSGGSGGGVPASGEHSAHEGHQK